jgi:hypothetical protein
LFFVLALVIAYLGTVPTVASAAGSGPTNADKELTKYATRDLRLAKADYEGTLRLPQFMPNDLHLMRVVWGGGPQVDVFWADSAADRVLHLWQVPGDVDLGTKDPTNQAPRGSNWTRVFGGVCDQQVACFSRRFADGAVVSADGTMPVRQLRRILATIR